MTLNNILGSEKEWALGLSQFVQNFEPSSNKTVEKLFLLRKKLIFKLIPSLKFYKYIYKIP